MNVILERPHKIFPIEDANKLAADLNADPEDDWTYVVVPNPIAEKKTGIIKVYDEENNFISNL